MCNKDRPRVLDYYEVRRLGIDTSKLEEICRFWIESTGITWGGTQRKLKRRLRRHVSKSNADLLMIEGTFTFYGFPRGRSYSIIEYRDPNKIIPKVLEVD